MKDEGGRITRGVRRESSSPITYHRVRCRFGALLKDERKYVAQIALVPPTANDRPISRTYRLSFAAFPSRRAAPGETPMKRLKARLNAASDW